MCIVSTDVALNCRNLFTYRVSVKRCCSETAISQEINVRLIMKRSTVIYNHCLYYSYVFYRILLQFTLVLLLGKSV